MRYELLCHGDFEDSQAIAVIKALGYLSTANTLGAGHMIDVHVFPEIGVPTVSLSLFSTCEIAGQHYGILQIEPVVDPMM